MRDPFDPFDLSELPAQRQTSSTPQAEVQLSYRYICRAHLLQAVIKPCQLDKNVTQQTAHTHTRTQYLLAKQPSIPGPSRPSPARVQFTSALRVHIE